MTTATTAYSLSESVATITLDDGKVNALSAKVLAEISDGLGRAESEAAVVVLSGRPGLLSAGFDLRCPPEGWPEMVAAGARLAGRLLASPLPVVVACNGSAVAMGAFLLLAADLRIGVDGEHRIGLNEVAIGLTLPWFGIELARHRLSRPYADRCTVTGVLLDPQEARLAGFLDSVVDEGELARRAGAAAQELARLDRAAHAATKLRVRERVIACVEAGAQRISPHSTDW